ncbi:MAG TPA: 4'-phosphopantetheinyl transferase superfamily protein [Polyangiaceae bacterium]|nr:4'-phosphopantetheinyl transferase superfamily protein [Polyangiaceae bacterium]
MSVRHLPSPALFEGPVGHVCLALEAGDIESWPQLFADIALPESLAKAVPKRKAEFVAGRHCARLALEQAAGGGGGPFAPLPVGPERAPVWPAGYVGSITHTHGYVAAAAARAGAVRSLGLDSERVMGAETAESVRSMVALEGELEALAGEGFDPWQLLTLVFSVKETLYKCLHPLVGRFFGFHEARLCSLDARAGRYVVELTKGLSGEFGPGMRFGGRFALGAGLVHTGMVLAAGGGAAGGGAAGEGAGA